MVQVRVKGLGLGRVMERGWGMERVMGWEG
jgi:hypothetical protein